ncbi:MAG: hypothetical protein WC792_03445 [Candidatus Micrarchaeia archaeon]|jgi:(p)ppGpp synthase/HD superfamily hydrolase
MARQSRGIFEKAGESTARKLAELEGFHPEVSRAISILGAATTTKRQLRKLEHVVDPAHRLLNTNDRALVAAMLLRQVPKKQRKALIAEKNGLSEEVLGLADAYWDANKDMHRQNFGYHSEISPEFVEFLHRRIGKEGRLVPMVVADFAQHLNDMAAVDPKKSPEVTRMRRKIAENGLRFWAPLAHAANWSLATEIEDASFRILDPENYQKTVDAYPKHNRKLLEDLEGRLREKLTKKGVNARIQKRVKGVYRTYLSLKRKKTRDMEQIGDLLGLRVIPAIEADEEGLAREQRAEKHEKMLRMVRGIGRNALAGVLAFTQSKDFVKEPKPHGYAALHDRYLLPGTARLPAQPIEVQYRTPEMHWKAEVHLPHYGYKEQWKKNPQLAKSIEKLLKNAHHLYEGYELDRQYQLHFGQKR